MFILSEFIFKIIFRRYQSYYIFKIQYYKIWRKSEVKTFFLSTASSQYFLKNEIGDRIFFLRNKIPRHLLKLNGCPLIPVTIFLYYSR